MLGPKFSRAVISPLAAVAGVIRTTTFRFHWDSKHVRRAGSESPLESSCSRSRQAQNEFGFVELWVAVQRPLIEAVYAATRAGMLAPSLLLRTSFIFIIVRGVLASCFGPHERMHSSRIFPSLWVGVTSLYPPVTRRLPFLDLAAIPSVFIARITDIAFHEPPPRGVA
jgi:hypothetical protein